MVLLMNFNNNNNNINKDYVDVIGKQRHRTMIKQVVSPTSQACQPSGAKSKIVSARRELDGH